MRQSPATPHSSSPSWAVNAITHTASAGTKFLLTVTYDVEGPVTIAVTDFGGTTTARTSSTPATTPPEGRGLALVNACVAAVRVSGDGYGHTVTAELRRP